MIAHDQPITDAEFKQKQTDRNVNNRCEYPESPWWSEVFTEFWPYLKEPFVDIGCRNGLLLDVLQSKGINDVAGIEITDIADFGQEMGRHIIKADIQKNVPVPDKSFKSATCLHTLEHCYDPAAAVEEIKRILDGHIIFIVPSEGKINYKFSHFCAFANHDDLADFLQQHGFEIIKHYSNGLYVHVVIAKV